MVKNHVRATQWVWAYVILAYCIHAYKLMSQDILAPFAQHATIEF